MTSIPDRLAQLTPEQRQQLIQKLAQRQVTQSPIAPRPEQTPAILSTAQQRLWLLTQITPNSPAYNRPCNLAFSGALDISALEASLNEILRRHEVLRSNFFNLDGQPQIQIRPSLTIALVARDLTHSHDPQAKLQLLSYQAAQRCFHLDRDPLVRAELIHLSDQEYVLLLTFHHIIFDGWSERIFKQELNTLYNAFSQKNIPPLASLPIQYTDFAHWQQSWLRGDRLQTQLNYWLKQLQNLPPRLELPTDRPRPPLQSHQGDRIYYQINAAQTTGLKQFSQAQGCTLFMTLMAAFQVLLFRYSGQKDIAVGVPIANRIRPEIEGLLGYFANTLVLRSPMEDDRAFHVFLQQVKETALQAYAHQDIAFDQIVTVLKPERDPSFSQLFQVLFGLQPTLEESGDWRSISLASGVVKLDLEVNLQEQHGAIVGFWQYNVDLFDRPTIERMMGCFSRLLESIVAHPEQSIIRLALTEQPQQITPNSPTEYYIYESFERQVERTPGAIALGWAEGQLSYSELNSQANQLAHYLIAQGIGAEDRVAIFLDRSPETIIALLAILKAGGAYVPIDPQYPGDRIDYILEDVQVALIVTRSQFYPQLAHASAALVCLDMAQAQIGSYPIHNPDRPTDRDLQNLAYIIYTSGSTGRPKGVMITQQAVAAFCATAIEVYELTERDRVLQFASLSFDAAVEEIYPILCVGGRLVLRTEAMIAPPTRFIQQCEDWQISVLDLPTAYWQQFVRVLVAEGLAMPRSVRIVIIGGEKVDCETVALWLANVGGFPGLINTYGPTEATVVAITHSITQQSYIDIPIGRAMGHTQAYVLDQCQQQVPIGVVGELYLGGETLARGYLNQPQATAAQFIPHPFGEGRLYRTGDLVRDRGDGQLIYLGRRDQQVKVRGFRVELGEVEQALLQLDGVQSVVVTQQPLVNGLELVAYVVLKGAIASTDLRGQLRQYLPNFMIPAVIMPLPCLPLTSNGKIDRQALPVPQITAAPQTPPQNHLEQQLVQIWQACLGLESVGVEDNFFDLGGHSLMALKMIAQIERQTGLIFGLNQLFQLPTIREIAQTIGQTTLSQSQLIPLRSGNDRAPLFLIHAGGPSVLFYQPLVQSLRTERALYGIESIFLAGDREDLNTLEAVAAAYLDQIRKIQPSGPYYFAGSSFGGIVAYEMAQQLRGLGEKVGGIILFDRAPPLGRYYLRGGPEGQTMGGAFWALRRIFVTQMLRAVLPVGLRQLFWRFQAGRNHWARRLGLPLGIKPADHQVYCRHIELLEGYQLQMYDGDVWVMRAAVPPTHGRFLRPDLGWEAYVTGSVKVWGSAGEHMSMFDPPHVEALARQIDRILDGT
jgi:amino acid adenylation domain-containing protein